MADNFHTPWVDDTNTWDAASLSPALASLDKAITYLKNIMIHCDGNITYDRNTGVIAWDSTIRIYFNREDGKAIENTIAAGSDTLADDEFLHVDLNETDGTVLTTANLAVTTDAASNFITVNRLVLAIRNTASDALFAPLLPTLKEVYKVQTTDATVTSLFEKTLTETEAYQVIAKVVAIEGDITNVASYHKLTLVYRATAGAVVMQGAVQDVTPEIEGDASWVCTFDVNSNDVRLRVTGVAATTIDWLATIDIIKIS